MKMNFPNNELAMVYRHAAGTKEDILAEMKEIVPVIRDNQARKIVESTIRELDAISEPLYSCFIAARREQFIQKRDNSIQCRLAEAKGQTGNGHNLFQSHGP